MNTVIYPRGFLGFENGQVQAVPLTNNFLQTVKQLQFNRPIPKNNNGYSSNSEVDTLWKEFIGGSSFITNFDFRQRILKTALSVFGTQNLLQWCTLQESNPFVTDMHKKFLNDTFMFIETGKRSVNITTWLNLVCISSNKTNSDNCCFNTKVFFRLDKSQDSQKAVGLETTLIDWTSQEGGFEDLLGTLAVLFGNIN